MTADDKFLNEMEQWVIGSLVFKKEHRERLFALARRGAQARADDQCKKEPPHAHSNEQ